MRIVRDYEVSIWTLQDSFITVLKPYGIELKGQIQDPDFKLVDDGTQEFTFKLPMYYFLNGERIENPLWCNTINGVIVASMRKVKLIFQKHEFTKNEKNEKVSKQKVYEFLITKVVETHEKDQLMCEITCEGLAFHELGKLGYKIALETDDITYEQDAWYDGEKMVDEQGKEYILGTNLRKYDLEMPQPTLQYWNDKIFKRSDGEWKWHWTYKIDMDYSNNPGLGREKNKVYEDEYISSWAYNSEHDQVEAQAYENNREKWRTVDLTESNVYNLTQDLAKQFGVFCRYEYEHDDNFHIIGRTVVYYNNFIMEKLGQIDVTYPYDASKIARTSDSTDMITKLYVKIDDSDENMEQITIMNSAANKTREDYILNFDYLHTVGAISDDQFNEVKKFEKNIYNLNMKIAPVSAQKISLESDLPDLEAKRTTLKNSIDLDKEQWSAQNDLLNSLTDNTGIITITNNNPRMGIILGDNPNYIKFTELGIDYSTLRIYKTYNTSSHVLTDEYLGKPVYDEFDNLIRVENLEHHQSYYYSPSSGLYSVSAEKGYLSKFEDSEGVAAYYFKFDSSGFKNLFTKLNRYLLTGFNFNFNVDFSEAPEKSFAAEIYFLHANEIDTGGTFIIGNTYNPIENQKRYVLNINVPLTQSISDFRFTTDDGSKGIIVKVILKHNTEDPLVNNSDNINKLKASLSLGGKIEAVESNASRVQSRVYLTYSYSPQLYYEKVREVWANRLATDNRNLETIDKKITRLKEKIDACQAKLNDYYLEQELLRTRFEKLMGPALREGYWQPEEYHDYGDRYLEIFSTKTSDIAYIYYDLQDEDIRDKVGYIEDTKDDTKVRLKFIYDSEPFEEETVNYIDSFSQENGEEYLYYPCIKLTNKNILSYVKENYDKLSVSFCDVTQLDSKYITNPVYRKVYQINSRCEYAFMNIDGVPTPVIMVTGARDDNLTDRQFAALTGQIYYDSTNNKTYDEFDNIDLRLAVIDPLNAQISTSCILRRQDWFIPTDKSQIIYPRLQISSLNLRADNDEIDIKYGGNLLTNYVDYSLLIRDNSYYATFKPKVFAQYGWGLDGEIRFIVSNANTSIYLDALQVSKENSRPKVEYEVTINNIKKDFLEEAYSYLGYITNINDFDLKFENVRGYISELDLKLDKPQEDTVTIKNYKTKFEDLFSTIVAQTEQMQKNATTIAVASQIFTTNGKLIPDVVEESIRHVNLDEAFSKGTLTWDEAEGMWAESDSGVVAIRGGGIFTATEQDAGGRWKWNTGITPEGINADLITAGQLDTNRIKVYAGDQLRFQLNADGLFAYKTMFDNPEPEYMLARNYAAISKEIQDNHGIDYRQYVVHNGEGIFLIAKQGAPLILEDRGQDGYYIRRTEQDIERVALTWDGLTLRNYNNEKVFYADANTGDLTIAGTIYAKAGVFEGEVRAQSLFIGEDTTQNYIDEDGHLLPTVFGDDIAGGITRMASLIVDSENGKIKLSSLEFDSLKGSSSGITIDPKRLYFYSGESYAVEGEDATQIIKNNSSVYIDTTGISIGTNGCIELNSSKASLRLSESNIYLSAVTTDEQQSDLENELETSSEFSLNQNGLDLHYQIQRSDSEKEAAIREAIQQIQLERAREAAQNNGEIFDEASYVYEEPTQDIIDEAETIVGDKKTTARVQLNEQGINVNGTIQIAGRDIWSKNNIVIMNPNIDPNSEDSWRKNQSSIEEHMKDQTDWILIKPNYNGTTIATFNPGNNSNYITCGVFYKIGTFVTNTVFANNSVSYVFEIKATYPHAANWANASFKFLLVHPDIASNSSQSDAPNVLNDSDEVLNNSIMFTTAISGVNASGKLTLNGSQLKEPLTLKNTSTLEVFKEQNNNDSQYYTDLYIYFSRTSPSGGYTNNLNISLIRLSMFANSTQGRAPCEVYYYA